MLTSHKLLLYIVIETSTCCQADTIYIEYTQLHAGPSGRAV